MKPQPAAYSYIRFSTPAQAEGDSLRRQTEAAKDWCRRHGARLDVSLSFRDLGKSAFLGEHRKNPDRFALAAFLKLVQDGRVARGSFLVIESLDRLTREHVRAGLMLLLGLIESGVRIVQLSPTELVYDEKSDEMQLMLAIVELSRGHRESKRKSDLQSAAWVEKRRKAREDGTLLTHKLPAWIEVRDGRLHLIPDRAAVVKRIFAMAAAGYGQKMTVRQLIREGVPAFGPAGHWNASYVGALVRDRRAIGEFQPRCRRGRKPQGPAIPNYFPAAVSEAEFYAARAGAAQRRNKRGRTGSHINLFAGLIKNALAGDSYYCAKRVDSRERGRTVVALINGGGHEGRVPMRTFPYPPFEEAMLSLLDEVDPREVLGEEGGPDEVVALEGELAAVEGKIAELEAELLHGDVPSIAKILRVQEERKRDLADRLAEARQKAAKPLSEAWGEAKGLLAIVADAPDPTDAKLRLRSALRRVMGEIWMLVVGRGHDRVCAVSVWFAEEGRRRDYLVYYRPERSNGKARQEAKWWARSISLEEVAGRATLDLRKREDAKRLEAALATVELAEEPAHLAEPSHPRGEDRRGGRAAPQPKRPAR